MTFAGTPDRVESRLVPEAGFPLDTFRVSGLPRRPSAAQLRAAWHASAAPAHCLRILARRRPDVVLGAGGYVAGPMVLAARLRGIPAALTEADAELGLANRLAAPFARRLFLAYEIPGRDGEKVRVVGRPIPLAHRGSSRGRRTPEIRSLAGRSGRRRLRRPRGGTVAERDGRRGVGRRRAGAPAHLRRARLRRAPPGAERPGYVLLSQTDHFGEALAAADLAVSRAGGTVWELAAAGTPAVLVPYPHATADHQTLNARHFERGGGAVVVPDAEVERIPALVAELLADPARLAAMREAMLALARPDAADVIADELVEARAWGAVSLC